METLRSIMTSPVVGYLVMTLLHSLWQGAIVAGGLWVLLRTIKGKPNMRYALGILGLAVLIVAQFATYSTWEQRADRPASESPAGVRLAPAQDRGPANVILEPPVASHGAKGRSEPPAPFGQNHFQRLQWQHVVFLLWCVGAFLMSIRTGMWLADVQRLRRRCAIGIDSRLCERINRLKELLAITRPIVIGFSNKVVVPCTVGLLRPMIVLPVNMAQMAGDEIESILLHELAHIKRLDWLVNILQMVLESLLFFNPAVWWISRQIRIEREAACDRYVVTRTRKPVHYAQLLLQFARTHHESSRAVAFASASDGSLTERVKRLIVPGYRAAVHPGIAPVLLTLAALIFCGVGAYKTTRATVRYFGKHMTPQQRAETVTALKEDYHTERRRPDLPEDQWIRVRGRIVVADGQPLPMKTSTYRGRTFTRVDAHLNAGTANVSATEQINRDGTFDITVKLTRFTLSVTSDDYAAKHVQMEAEPGEVIDDLVIELEKGYTSYIVCTDPDGHPIPEAVLTGGYPMPRYGGYTHSIKLTTDQEGVATIDNASEALMSLTCQAPGFAKARKQKFQLAEGQRMTWVLQPTPAACLHVTDARTGDPIEGVSVCVKGPEFNSSFISYRGGDSVTDTSGQAVLDSLVPNEVYSTLIYAKSMQRRYLNIQAGQDVDVALEPVQPIRCRILGDLSKLPIEQDGLRMKITNAYWSDSTTRDSRSTTRRVPLTIIDPCQATFEIDDYYGQEVTLQIESAADLVELDIEAGDHLHEVFIHLDPEETQEGVRMVRFQFTGLAPDDIPPGTQFRVTYRPRGQKYGQARFIEIVDGRAKLVMPMTESIGWRPEVGTSIFFKSGRQKLDEDRDYTIDVPTSPGGSLYGTIDVPKAFQYKHAYIRLEFKNRSEMFEQTGFLEHTGLNLTTGPQARFLFNPLPLGGEYVVTATCETMMLVSDLIRLTPDQPLCEMKLPWPERTVNLHGRVLDPNGNPAADVPYRIVAKGGGPTHSFSEQRTGVDGSFFCGPVNPDDAIDYRLRVQSALWPCYEYPLETSDKPVTLKLKPGVVCSGVLKDHDGNLRPNVEFPVEVRHPRGDSEGYVSKTIKTDSQGRFQTVLGDIEYKYSSRRRLIGKDGRKSWTFDLVKFHPGKDITIVCDPH